MVAGKTGVGVPDEEPERPQDTEKSDRARAALLEAQMDAALDGIISVSPRNTLLSFNHRFEEIWGLPQGYLKVGSPLSDVVGRISAWVSERAAFEAEILSTNGLAGKVRVGPGGRLKSFSMVDGRTLTFFSAPALDVSGGYHGRVWFFREDPSGPQIAGSDDLLARLHAAERAQAFLLRAAGALAGTSGYLETVERMAEVALPVLGDLFLIDIVDEREEIVRVVARHADPAMQPATDRLLTEFAPDTEAPDPCVQVIQTRRARWAASTSDAFLRASTRNESHYELLRELNFTSYMCVPIFDGDKVLGAVTLISSGSGRHFGLDDLALVEALSEPVAQVVMRAMQYEQQHGIALVLQTNLLPPSLPDIEGLAVAAQLRRRHAWSRGGWRLLRRDADPFRCGRHDGGRRRRPRPRCCGSDGPGAYREPRSRGSGENACRAGRPDEIELGADRGRPDGDCPVRAPRYLVGGTDARFCGTPSSDPRERRSCVIDPARPCPASRSARRPATAVTAPRPAGIDAPRGSGRRCWRCWRCWRGWRCWRCWRCSSGGGEWMVGEITGGRCPVALHGRTRRKAEPPDAGGNCRTHRARRQVVERRSRGVVRRDHLAARWRSRASRRCRPSRGEHQGFRNQGLRYPGNPKLNTSSIAMFCSVLVCSRLFWSRGQC